MAVTQCIRLYGCHLSNRQPYYFSTFTSRRTLVEYGLFNLCCICRRRRKYISGRMRVYTKLRRIAAQLTDLPALLGGSVEEEIIFTLEPCSGRRLSDKVNLPPVLWISFDLNKSRVRCITPGPTSNLLCLLQMLKSCRKLSMTVKSPNLHIQPPPDRPSSHQGGSWILRQTYSWMDRQGRRVSPPLEYAQAMPPVVVAAPPPPTASRYYSRTNKEKGATRKVSSRYNEV